MKCAKPLYQYPPTFLKSLCISFYMLVLPWTCAWAGDIDPCELLTKADAEKILGGVVDDPVKTGGSHCGYANATYESVAVSIEDASAFRDTTAQELADKLNEIQSNNSLTANFPPWRPITINGYLAVAQDLPDMGMSNVRIAKNDQGLLVVAPTLEQVSALAQTLISRLP